MTFLEKAKQVLSRPFAWGGIKPGQVGWEMLSGIMPTAGGAAPNRGTAAQLQGYNTMPWVRAIAGKVGWSVAATQWRLFANKGKPKQGQPARRAMLRKDIALCPSHRLRKQLMGQIHDKDELTEITDHPLLDMMNNGNPLHSGMDLRKLASISRDIIGEAFWLVERDGALGIPVALWPVPANWILETPTPSQQAYRVSFRTWQGYIPASEMLWFKDLDPAMPYWRGSGIAQALADELETDEYSAKYLKQFFYNGARPEVVISPKGEFATFSPDQLARLDRNWQQQHGGFWRAFKPMFAHQAIQVDSFPANFEHLQLKDLRMSLRDIALHVWGVPPELLGIIENSNRATIDAADYLFSKWVVLPRLEAWRLDFQRMLVPQYDERLILEFETPVQQDLAFRKTVMADHQWAFEADEIRELAGLAPIEDELGGFHMEPTNLTYRPDWEAPEPEPMLMPGAPGAPGAFANGNGKPAPKPKPAAKGIAKMTDEELLAKALEMAHE